METDNIKLAKTIDFINEWVIKYYNREKDEKPDPYKLEEALHNIGIDYKYFEYARRIMKYEDLVDYISNDENDNIIRELRHTDKGLMLFLNGGMLKKVNREKNKATLVIIAQIAASLGGLHYLFENCKHLIDTCKILFR